MHGAIFISLCSWLLYRKSKIIIMSVRIAQHKIRQDHVFQLRPNLANSSIPFWAATLNDRLVFGLVVWNFIVFYQLICRNQFRIKRSK